jgi:L-threonylcarbamoyladenylate synthase
MFHTMGKILRIDPASPDLAGQLAPAVRALVDGKVVVFPTETLYGLAADYANPEAIDRLIKLKGRPDGKPIALIVGDRAAVDELITGLPKGTDRLMERYWPGPLSLIFQAKPGLDPRLKSRDGGVGMRMSPHPIAAGLARGLARAITATSANLSGRPATRHFDKLDPEVIARADLAIDAGSTPGGPASTVLDMRGANPRVLREGAISRPDWRS